MPEICVTEDQLVQAVREVFRGRRKEQSLRRVLYTIYVRESIAAGRRQADRGELIPHEQVMDAMWNQINTGLSGQKMQRTSSGKS